MSKFVASDQHRQLPILQTLNVHLWYQKNPLWGSANSQGAIHYTHLVDSLHSRQSYPGKGNNEDQTQTQLNYVGVYILDPSDFFFTSSK